MTDDVSGEKQSVVYQVTSQHWAHAEQIRWTLLYNLLVANTILLLAWAAIFATTVRPPGARVILVGLCVVGLLVSLLWVFLERRANGFSLMYTRPC
jgi:protein-S-isoprenylcysteine O-methyltransferase Ste14